MAPAPGCGQRLGQHYEICIFTVIFISWMTRLATFSHTDPYPEVLFNKCWARGQCGESERRERGGLWEVCKYSVRKSCLLGSVEEGRVCCVGKLSSDQGRHFGVL